MLANNLARGLFKLNRLNVLKTRNVLYSKHYRGEFWDKNVNRLKRPLSPHLSIYKMPQTALTSITHRVTGACMTVAIISFGVGSFFFAGKFDKVLDYLRENVHPHVLLLGKMILSFPIVWHTCAGIRHLVWDTGRGLGLPTVYKTGYGLMAVAFCLTLILATSNI